MERLEQPLTEWPGGLGNHKIAMHHLHQVLHSLAACWGGLLSRREAITPSGCTLLSWPNIIYNIPIYYIPIVKITSYKSQLMPSWWIAVMPRKLLRYRIYLFHKLISLKSSQLNIKLLVWKHYHYSRQGLLACSSLIFTVNSCHPLQRNNKNMYIYLYMGIVLSTAENRHFCSFTELLWHVSRKFFTLFIPGLKLCLIKLSMQSFFSCFHFFFLFIFYPFLLLFRILLLNSIDWSNYVLSIYAILAKKC